jgi:hypothetical protein
MQVDNCDRLSKPRLVKPNLSTEEPVCPDGQLQCGNGKRSIMAASELHLETKGARLSLDLAEWSERLAVMPKSQQSWVRSQHPPTQWNFRGGI